MILVLFVPHNKTGCTKPIRMNNGTTLQSITLSSLNNLSVLIHLPKILIKMTTNEKSVHHQLTIKVGFICNFVWNAGASFVRGKMTIVIFCTANRVDFVPTPCSCADSRCRYQPRHVKCRLFQSCYQYIHNIEITTAITDNETHDHDGEGTDSEATDPRPRHNASWESERNRCAILVKNQGLLRCLKQGD